MLKKIILLCLNSAIFFATPQTVIIIRHAEKTDDTQTVMFKRWKIKDSKPLSVKGWQRAEALKIFFQQDPKITKFGEIFALFAPKPCENFNKPKPDDCYNSVRPIQTLTPLSELIHKPIQCKYSLDDKQFMIKEILHDKKYHNKCILIAYEHQNITDLAHKLGASMAPKYWPSHTTYDRVWIIEFDTKTGKVSYFTDMPQRLLFNDSKK